VRAVAAEAGIAPMGSTTGSAARTGLVDALLIRGFDRLRESIAAGTEPDKLERLRSCGLRYRRFALGNPALLRDHVRGGDPAPARLGGGGRARRGGVR